MLFSGVSARRGTTMASGKVEGYKRTRLCEKCQKPPPTGVALLYCEHCEVIGYCSEECKKEHRVQHEQQCGRLASTRDRTVTAYKNCGVEVNCYEAGSFPGCPHPPPRGRPPTAPPAKQQNKTPFGTEFLQKLPRAAFLASAIQKLEPGTVRCEPSAGRCIPLLHPNTSIRLCHSRHEAVNTTEHVALAGGEHERYHVLLLHNAGPEPGGYAPGLETPRSEPRDQGEDDDMRRRTRASHSYSNDTAELVE